MRKLILLLLLLSISCTVPGKIVLKKTGDRWEAVEVTIETENITPAEIQSRENRLNAGK